MQLLFRVPFWDRVARVTKMRNDQHPAILPHEITLILKRKCSSSFGSSSPIIKTHLPPHHLILIIAQDESFMMLIVSWLGVVLNSVVENLKKCGRLSFYKTLITKYFCEKQKANAMHSLLLFLHQDDVTNPVSYQGPNL